MDPRGVTLTDSFHDDARAVKVLCHYFRRPLGENSGFTGSVWDTFDPDGNRASTTDIFTAQDLVACALLSTAIPGRAALELLDLQNEHFGGLLQAIGEDRPFVDEADPDRFDFEPVRALYRDLRLLPGIGPTRATKLIARKRPHLVPIVDGVIDQVIFNQSGDHWAPLHAALITHECWLWKKLQTFKEQAELPEEIPVLRVFDVLTWMDGTGKYSQALQQ